MRLRARPAPRAFHCGRRSDVVMHDTGSVELEADEQVTFTTDAGGEYDVARKSWGFYATPSLNGRLARFGLRPALVRNGDDRCFVVLVEAGHEAEFADYAASERLEVAWLDPAALSEVFGG